MGSTLYFCNYNNYYNRILKFSDLLTTYTAGTEGTDYYKRTGINFNVRDGISTEQYINLAENEANISPDYLVVTADGNSVIKSRWFIIERTFSRNMQYRFLLRRDVLADYYDDYKNEPFFCERGPISSTSNIYIYNSEPMEFNQRKVAQAFIGSANYAYIVAYIADDGNQYEVKSDVMGTPHVDLTIPASRGNYDAPYSILSWQIGRTASTGSISQVDNAMRLAFEMAASLYGSGALYDIQLLPYKPPTTAGTSTITTTFLAGSQITVTIHNSASRTFTDTVFSSDVVAATNVQTGKWKNQTEFVRLCSPGSASCFEFSPFKNGNTTGVKLNVVCTFRPIQPYFHIYPDFGGLYVQNYNLDSRGLVVTGDYSLPLITDAWQTYEINNKNYMNAFNRQTESLELQQKYQRVGQITSIIGGSISAGISAGMQTANPAVGIAAAAGNALLGAVDYEMSEQLRNDALDLRQDLFNYNLQNIQATPITLSRISSLCRDSQLFPYAELYKATESGSYNEKQTFLDRLKYYGCTCNFSTTFKTMFDACNSNMRFVKGRLIRCSTIKDDTHLVNVIADELNKGVYAQ